MTGQFYTIRGLVITRNMKTFYRMFIAGRAVLPMLVNG